MRFLVAVTALALAGGCAGGTSGPAASPSQAPSTTASAVTSTAAAVDPCTVLSNDELIALAGGSVGESKPGLTGGIPNCQWEGPDGWTIQTIATSASDWAQALPETLRVIEASGMVTDQAQLKQLKQAATLVKGGGRVDPTEACDLFSQLLELRGEPAGTPYTVNIYPSKEDPQGVAGQMCSGGRFTSVGIISGAGLTDPLPVEQVVTATKAAHRRALS